MKPSVWNMAALTTACLIMAQANAGPHTLPGSLASPSASPMRSVTLPSSSTRTQIPDNPRTINMALPPLANITPPANHPSLESRPVTPPPANHPSLQSSGTVTLPNHPPLTLGSKSIDASRSLSSSPGRF